MDKPLSALLIAVCGDDEIYIYIYLSRYFMHIKCFLVLNTCVCILCRRDAMNISKMDNDEG